MPISLIPAPTEMTTSADSFAITENTQIVADEASRPALEVFLSQLRAATGWELPLADEGDIQVSCGEEGEGYTLTVDGGVSINADGPHGVFNATQTLRQLLPAGIETTGAANEWVIPGVSITDSPVYAYRGLMIDVARSFLTVEEMKRLIDSAAAVKASRLHLHLSDDQGWRIEITNDGRVEGDPIDYTRLTEISGATAMSERGYQDEPGRTGFYTQADYQEIVRYAQERFITVVPEIDLPGHTIGALAAIEELNTPGASNSGGLAQPDGSADVGHSYLDPHSEHTYHFARHVLRQIAEITPGDYLHVGGDEPLKMTERYGHDVYIECVSKIVQIVRELGKKPAGWNELAQAGPGPDMLVQFWQGESTHTLEAAEAGAHVILSRGESAYLDQKYHPDFPIGLDWACKGDCDFPAYYSWEPTELVPGLENIAGVEAPLWSETIRGVEQAEFMIFPRLYAIAELGWSAPHTRSLESFTKRVATIAPRLLVSGRTFYAGKHAKWEPITISYTDGSTKTFEPTTQVPTSER